MSFARKGHLALGTIFATEHREGPRMDSASSGKTIVVETIRPGLKLDVMAIETALTAVSTLSAASTALSVTRSTLSS